MVHSGWLRIRTVPSNLWTDYLFIYSFFFCFVFVVIEDFTSSVFVIDYWSMQIFFWKFYNLDAKIWIMDIRLHFSGRKGASFCFGWQAGFISYWYRCMELSISVSLCSSILNIILMILFTVAQWSPLFFYFLFPAIVYLRGF